MNKKSNFSKDEKNAVNIPVFNPELTKEERERIFMKSKEKLSKMIEEKNNFKGVNSEDTQDVQNIKFAENKTDNEDFEDPEDTESEREIKVSRLKPIISAVACLVLAAGLSGIMFLLYSGNKNVDISDSSSSQTQAMAVTSQTNQTKAVQTEQTQNTNNLETAQINEKTTKSAQSAQTEITKSPVTESTTENSEKEKPKKSEKNDSSIVTTVIPQTTKIRTKKPDSTTSKKENTSSSDNNNVKNEEYTQIAEKLRDGLNTIYFMTMGGGVKFDKAKEPYYYQLNGDLFGDEYPDGKVPYNYVSDSRFSSTADIKNYMNSIMTENFKSASGYYNGIFNENSPKFIDYNGHLYGLEILASRSGGGGYHGKIKEIKDVTENSFTAYIDQMSYNLILKIVKENGVWKINEMIN